MEFAIITTGTMQLSRFGSRRHLFTRDVCVNESGEDSVTVAYLRITRRTQTTLASSALTQDFHNTNIRPNVTAEFTPLVTHRFFSYITLYVYPNSYKTDK